MVDQRLLAMLRCPEDRSSLSPADAVTLQRINEQIQAGRLRNKAGQRVDRTIEGGLVRAAGDLLYPILDHIPVLLYEEAIPLEQLDD